MTTHEAAAEIFKEAWGLYTKYENGPQSNPDMYWHNLAVEGGNISQRWPCEFTEDIVKAVIAEHSRREKRKSEESNQILPG